MSKKIKLILEADLLQISELTHEEAELVNSAKKALKNAYAPYSNFQVGSAVLLENGTVVKGSNQENAAYPSGLCAERVAIFSAGANHPNKEIKMVAIAAKPAAGEDYVEASSCGNCRQAMMEYQSKQKGVIRLLFVRPNDEILITSVSDLLPFGFSSSDLFG
jgi:cytidine deaminase